MTMTFHELWASAHDEPGYVKSDWMALARAIDSGAKYEAVMVDAHALLRKQSAAPSPVASPAKKAGTPVGIEGFVSGANYYQSNAVPVTAKDVGCTLLTYGTADADGTVRLRVVGDPFAPMTPEREAEVRSLVASWAGSLAVLGRNHTAVALAETLTTIDALRATIARQAEVIAAAHQNVLRYGACTHPRATVTPPATAGEPMTYCPDCGLFAVCDVARAALETSKK